MQKQTWFIIALISALVAAPHAMIIRDVLSDADPFYWNMLRFGVAALICLPWVVKAWRVVRRPNVLGDLCIASVMMGIAGVCYVLAIYNSQASYVSIITLTVPLVFIALSVKLVGDRLSRQSIAGVSIGAAGALLLIALPVALSHSQTVFYPVATLYAAGNVVTFCIATIYLRKTNEAGLPMMATIGIVAGVAAVVNACCFLVFGDQSKMPVSPVFLGAVAYSGIAVIAVSQALKIVAYERLGAATISAIGYVETLVAIILPVFILHERLSPAMIVGGALILLGVYVVESRHREHGAHHWLHRHHS